MEHFKLENPPLEKPKPPWYNDLMKSRVDESVWDGVDADFTPEDVWRTIRRSPGKKHPGMDGITGDLLKISCNPDNMETNWVLLTITRYLNLVYSTSNVPQKAKNALIMLQKKKPIAEHWKSFRPLAMICEISKLLSRLLAERTQNAILKCFPESFDQSSGMIVTEDQQGFVPFGTTSAAISRLLQVIEHAKRNNNPLIILSLDSSSAFDNVPIEQIAESLRSAGAPQKLIDYITAYLTDAEIVVSTKWGGTEPIHKGKGTAQGDCFSPMIFSLTIQTLILGLLERGRKAGATDFPTGYRLGVFETVAILAYADDILLVSSSIKGLAEAFRWTKTWMSFWNWKLNPQKSVLTARNLGKSLENFEFMYEGEVIPPRNSKTNFRYLGMMINLSLDWTEQILCIDRQINAVCRKIRTERLSLQEAGITLREYLLPKIEYSFKFCEIAESQLREWTTKLVHMSMWAAGINHATFKLESILLTMKFPHLVDFYKIIHISEELYLAKTSYALGSATANRQLTASLRAKTENKRYQRLRKSCRALKVEMRRTPTRYMNDKITWNAKNDLSDNTFPIPQILTSQIPPGSTIIAFTDGSTVIENDDPEIPAEFVSGWSAIIFIQFEGNVFYSILAGTCEQDIYHAESLAACAVLEWTPRNTLSTEILLDSQSVVHKINDLVMIRKLPKKMLRIKARPVLLRIRKLIHERDNVEVNWLRGHMWPEKKTFHSLCNHVADAFANTARVSLQLPPNYEVGEAVVSLWDKNALVTGDYRRYLKNKCRRLRTQIWAKAESQGRLIRLHDSFWKLFCNYQRENPSRMKALLCITTGMFPVRTKQKRVWLKLGDKQCLNCTKSITDYSLHLFECPANAENIRKFISDIKQWETEFEIQMEPDWQEDNTHDDSLQSIPQFMFPEQQWMALGNTCPYSNDVLTKIETLEPPDLTWFRKWEPLRPILIKLCSIFKINAQITESREKQLFSTPHVFMSQGIEVLNFKLFEEMQGKNIVFYDWDYLLKEHMRWKMRLQEIVAKKLFPTRILVVSRHWIDIGEKCLIIPSVRGPLKISLLINDFSRMLDPFAIKTIPETWYTLYEFPESQGFMRCSFRSESELRKIFQSILQRYFKYDILQEKDDQLGNTLDFSILLLGKIPETIRDFCLHNDTEHRKTVFAAYRKIISKFTQSTIVNREARNRKLASLIRRL